MLGPSPPPPTLLWPTWTCTTLFTMNCQLAFDILSFYFRLCVSTERFTAAMIDTWGRRLFIIYIAYSMLIKQTEGEEKKTKCFYSINERVI